MFISFFAVYFLLAYLNVHNLIFLSMVHEYAYKTYEYISKLANTLVKFALVSFLGGGDYEAAAAASADFDSMAVSYDAQCCCPSAADRK